VYVAPGGDPAAPRVFDHPGLRVAAASPEHLLAMKVLAASLIDRIWQLRNNVTASDAAYVAAAEALECTLVTGDRRLAKIAGTRCEIEIVPAF
jgi:predicted nucleic acid-binding protein